MQSVRMKPAKETEGTDVDEWTQLRTAWQEQNEYLENVRSRQERCYLVFKVFDDKSVIVRDQYFHAFPPL